MLHGMVSLLLCFWCPNSNNQLLCSLNSNSIYDWEEITSEQLNLALLIFHFRVFPDTATTTSNTSECLHTLPTTASRSQGTPCSCAPFCTENRKQQHKRDTSRPSLPPAAARRQPRDCSRGAKGGREKQTCACH